MSVLEPDSAADHVFPHVREAIRAWAAHRRGKDPSRAGLGSIRGKGPEIGDILRVGQALNHCGVWGRRTGISKNGADLIDWAHGKRPRTAKAEGGTHALELYIARVTRRMRADGILAKAAPLFNRRSDVWVDAEGDRHKTTGTVDIS